MSFGTLTITMADGRKYREPIDKPMLRIGRDSDNDVVINDPSVSSYHARIFADDAGLSILDIGSRNGTEVDGALIVDRTPIGPATRIRIGTATLRIEPAGAAAGAATTAPPTGGFVLPAFPEAPAPAVGAPAADAAATAVQGGARPDGPPLVRIEFLPPQAKADITQGGPAVLSYNATVQNLSRFVDRLELAVDAPPWAAAVVDPPFHNLMPGQTGTSRITLSVPRASESSAGVHPIELVARSQKRPELRFTAASELTVTPFTDFRFELLDPKARTAWTGGRFRVRVVNLSNRALPFNLEGANTDGALSFRFDPDPIELKAGEQGESRLRTRFGFMRLFGQPKTYDFTLSAEPLDQSAPIQQAQGRLIQRPPLPPWMLIAGAVLSLLALLLACSSLLIRNRQPIEAFFRGLFALPAATATSTATLEPTTDVTAMIGAVQTDTAATQSAALTALAQSAVAAQDENEATQTAVAADGAATQDALQTSAAGTQTAAASQIIGTATAEASQVAATMTAAASQFAGTATAQANGTGTALAGTATALAGTASVQARTATAPTAIPTTPTLAPPPGPSVGQVITFDRLRTLPVNVRVPIVGDEYAAQDAFFCFYRPVGSESGLGSSPEIPVRAAGYSRQQQANGVTISDVAQAEGSSGGTTNFAFRVTWVDNPPILQGVQARPALQERVLTIQFATSDGGSPDLAVATSPADYLPQSATVVLLIPEGQNQAEAFINIAVIADNEFEPNEAFTVSLFNPSLPVNILDPTGIGVIQNDDQPPTATPSPTATLPPSATPTIPPSATPAPDPVPAGDAFDCQPPVPSGTSLQLLRGVIYPPPVLAANSAPFHSLTTDAGEGALINDSIAVINFQRNVAEVNVDVWYPGGAPAAYVMFAFDERGTLIATAHRDAIGVPATYQLNVRSVERPVRQVVIEARREFAGQFSGSYDYEPVTPPLLSRVEFRYTNP